ncbi:MAG: carbohydrate ABC transporter permease [Firmicutes bacterium]|nr:carbohydrate ABC transporter permease [Bacillota bacterium]
MNDLITGGTSSVLRGMARGRSSTTVLACAAPGIRGRRLLAILLTHAVLIICSIIAGYPIVWLVLNSFKTETQLYSNTFSIPTVINWENYREAIELSRIGTFIWNSIFVTTSTVIIVVFLGSLAAYAFARLRFRGREILFYTFLISMILPPTVSIIPQFTVVVKLHLINTYFGLILPYASGGLAFAIFLFRGFLAGLPRELEEAALIDGCSLLRVYSQIVIPLSKPIIATVTIFQFMNTWNEFFWALLAAQDPTVATIPVGLINFSTQWVTKWPSLFAVLTLAAVPIIIVYVALQGQFISGLTSGALKG